MKDWKEGLTKEEIQHLQENGGIDSMYQLVRLVQAQEEMRSLYPSNEPCWICKAIGRKLRLIKE